MMTIPIMQTHKIEDQLHTPNDGPLVPLDNSRKMVLFHLGKVPLGHLHVMGKVMNQIVRHVYNVQQTTNQT